MLFADVERTDASPKRATESEFVFLNRSARPAVGVVREMMEACLSNYPVDEAVGLIDRIQCGDDRHFASASFELFIHEYLRRLGMTLTPHPELPNGSTKRPDFLVECANGGRLYLEAVCASDDTERSAAAEARKAVALQVLDDVHNPNFMVSIESEGDPATQPSGRGLAAEVDAWLSALDADALLEVCGAGDIDALPEFHWQHEEWRVRIRPIPVNVEARGRQRRLIGARSFGASWIDGWSPVRDAVLSKGRRYGDLDLPLIVAVNVNTFNLDQIDEAQALFGQEQFVFSRSNPDLEPRMERAPNGAWRGPSGPRGKRASGAWLFNNLSPYTLSRRRHTLYVNPTPNYPIPNSFLLVPHVLVVDGYLRAMEGIDMAAAFDLPPTWPE
jgi:hypothetical protein